MPFEMLEGSEHAEFWNALQNGESGIYDTLVQGQFANFVSCVVAKTLNS